MRRRARSKIGPLPHHLSSAFQSVLDPLIPYDPLIMVLPWCPEVVSGHLADRRHTDPNVSVRMSKAEFEYRRPRTPPIGGSIS